MAFADKTFAQHDTEIPSIRLAETQFPRKC
jgi:hypothetical protein